MQQGEIKSHITVGNKTDIADMKTFSGNILYITALQAACMFVSPAWLINESIILHNILSA